MQTDFLESILSARTDTDVQRHFLETLDHLGFSHGLYAARFMLSLPDSIFREDYYCFGNFPAPFMDAIESRQLLASSHWMTWSHQQTGSAPCQQIDTGLTSECARLADRHGLNSGYVLSLGNQIPDVHGMVVVTPHAHASPIKSRRLWENAGGRIRMLSTLLHFRMATLRRNRRAQSLTSRQREVLEWSAAGKTVSETAVILGVSAATVEKHLRLARAAMSAGNTAQAILKAYVTDQLFTTSSDKYD